MAWWDRFFGKEQELVEDDLVKAKKTPVPAPQAWEIDPQDYQYAFGGEDTTQAYHPGTMGLDYETLRWMARVPLISSIIQTRVNQVSEFAMPQETPHSLGFKIRMRDRFKEPTKAAKNKMAEMTRWLQTCGDPRIEPNHSFETFLRCIVRDSLVFDQAAFELVRTRGGNIAGFIPVDASTIRRAKLGKQERERGRRNNESGFVQIINSKIVAKWTQNDMVVGIRRPRTWVHVNGYGYPELEELIRTITNLLNAEAYNAANFTHGMHVSGVLAIKSKMNPQLFRAFRREFYAMLSGASKAKKTPLIQLDPENKEELQSINMSSSNREMEYQEWISWLLRLACSVYQISPSSLGGQWMYGNEGHQNSLATGGPTDRISASNELGLRPLMRAVEGWLNRGIIHRLDPDFEIHFAGFDAKTEDQKLDMDLKAIKAFRTVNEIRAAYDLGPIDSPAADMILDPTYMNTAWQMSMNEEGEEGGEGGEGEEGGEMDFDLDALFANAGVGEEEPEPEPELEPEPEPEPAFGKSLSKKRVVSVEVD